MGKYEMTARVRYSEVDPDERLTTGALVNLLQDCAAFHCESIEYDMDYLRQKDWGWFVTSWQIACQGTRPRLGDELTVATWGYRFYGMFAYRSFAVTRPDGSIYAKADSLWLLMDLKSGRPVRIPEEMVSAYGTLPRQPGPWRGRKITPADGSSEVFRFRVQKYQLDSNGHMNNSRYIQIAAACLPAGVTIDLLRTEYKMQAREGDLVIVRTSAGEDAYQVILADEAGRLYCIVEAVTIN